MVNGKYIKVTLPTGREAVVMAALLPFYASQNAKISEPTAEEILESFPEERAFIEQARRDESLVEQNRALRYALAAANAEIERLKVALAAKQPKQKTTKTK